MALRPIAILAALAAFLVLAAPAMAAKRSSWSSKSYSHATKKKRAKASSSCQNTTKRPGEASIDAMAASTVCLLNKQRARRGLRKLRLDSRLSRAARSHTVDMVRRNYFSHVSRSGSDIVDRLSRTGYMRGARAWTVGENLAWGSGTRSTPSEIMEAWMRSPGHKANILQRRFREIGIGVVFAAPRNVGGLPAATYTTTFGYRR